MLRVGIIGIQGYGRTSLFSLASRKDATVTALCDLDGATTKRIAEERSIPHAFTDYREMLMSDTVDAVIVATPHFLHYPMTMEALAAGKHVFCEKPLAITVAEVEAMVDAADRSGRILTCHYNQRVTPYVQVMRALIARGEIGACYHANVRWMARWTGFMFQSASKWRTELAKAGGGIFIGRGSHLVDAIWYVLGEPPISAIHATTQNRLTQFEVDDYAAATLYLESGATVHIECSYALPTPIFQEKMDFELYGTCGGMTYSRQESCEPDWKVGHFAVETGTWQERLVDMEDVSGPVSSLLDNFLDAILYDSPLIVTARSAASVTKILAAGYESARTREVVPINQFV